MYANPARWAAAGWQNQFTNQSGEVDWGALAKQWIAQKEQQPETSAVISDSSQNGHEGPPHQDDRFGDGQAQNWSWGDTGTVEQAGKTSENWPGIPASSWAAAPPPPPPEPPVVESQTFDYGHGNTNFQRDYNSDYMEYSQGYDSQDGYDTYWGDQSAPMSDMPSRGPPPHMRRNFRGSDRDDLPHSGPGSVGSDTPIDAQKRRLLPAWIREGLEKMERQKQKEQDKERKMKEAEESRKQKEKEEAEAEEELRKETEAKGGVYIPRKSKFDTDDEESDADDASSKKSASVERETVKKPRVPTPEPEPEPEPEMSEEEKQAKLMVKVRTWLTEVLLEVTNEETEDICHEVVARERKKKTKGSI